MFLVLVVGFDCLGIGVGFVDRVFALWLWLVRFVF